MRRIFFFCAVPPAILASKGDAMAWSPEKLRSLAIPPDTTPEAARVQLEIYRRMPPGQRLRLVLALSDSLRAVVAAGVRTRHPEFNAQEVKLSVARLTLGEELFRKVYPGVRLPR
jgi:hypothetical protein